MSKTFASRGYARLALTPGELRTLHESRIKHSEIKATDMKIVYVEFDDLDQIVDLLKWRKQRGH